MLEVAAIADTLEAMAVMGGGTFDLVEGAPASQTTGYYVGGADNVEAITFPVDGPADWEAAISTVRAARSAYVGVWEDGGLYYVDATERVEDKRVALKLGAERGELAIWDIAGQTSIYL